MQDTIANVLLEVNFNYIYIPPIRISSPTRVDKAKNEWRARDIQKLYRLQDTTRSYTYKCEGEVDQDVFIVHGWYHNA